MENAQKPRPSLFAIHYGSFDSWVERAVLPGVESGALDPEDMIVIVACLRSWEADGAWGRTHAR